MIDLQSIARHYGGTFSGGNALIPTPGHSRRDRGTSIKLCPDAPDGLLVHCFNADSSIALSVKDMLRADGFLSPKNGRALTVSERRSIRQSELARKQERLGTEEMAARSADSVWATASRADPAHPYLISKGLKPFGIRQAGSALLVPMFDPSFRLWNIQRIQPDGFKLFSKGARTAGLFWPHAIHFFDSKPTTGPLVIGEGFATMAVVHAETGFAVAAAMSVRNLETVAQSMRKLFPVRELVIAADDDRHLSENIGLNAAIKAAEAVGGVVATPRPETHLTASSADFADITRASVSARIQMALREK